MPQSFRIDAGEFVAFSKALRKLAPDIEKRMRSAINKEGRIAATGMRGMLPHKGSGAEAGIRWSSAASAKGGAVVIGGLDKPQSYAYAFGVGNRPSSPGFYIHPVFGHYGRDVSKKALPHLLMRTSDFVEVGWRTFGTRLMVASDEAIDMAVQALSWEERR